MKILFTFMTLSFLLACNSHQDEPIKKQEQQDNRRLQEPFQRGK